MPDKTRVEQLEVWVGGLTRRQLMRCLGSRGILVNGHAETLLEDAVFDGRPPHPVIVTERTVAQLGLRNGATLPQIFEAAQQQGLLLCPVDTGPYLRMELHGQAASRDFVMSSGRAPDGGLTVAAEALSQDDDHPKGFYLRVVDGQTWLRGYRCDDEYKWSPDDRFVFQLPPTPDWASTDSAEEQRPMIRIERDNPGRADVQQLLSEHLADMFATSPAESVHALDSAALSGPGITFWTAREDTELLGCGAMKLLEPGEPGIKQGEIKSMRTAAHARSRGVATALLAHLVAEARQAGYDRLYLETGSQDFFAPARRLYQRHGFGVCPPFAGYSEDPNSVYMTLALDPSRP